MTFRYFCILFALLLPSLLFAQTEEGNMGKPHTAYSASHDECFDTIPRAPAGKKILLIRGRFNGIEHTISESESVVVLGTYNSKKALKKEIAILTGLIEMVGYNCRKDVVYVFVPPACAEQLEVVERFLDLTLLLTHSPIVRAGSGVTPKNVEDVLLDLDLKKHNIADANLKELQNTLRESRLKAGGNPCNIVWPEK